ncbi:hypothetical protein I6D99_12180, partial [Staphylococcus aureus]|nr:hypothetical protein [Staphylococcus aureus]
MTKRNPKLAALLSVIPGLGQFYNKRPIKGTIFFIFFISFISVFYSFLNIGFWGLFTLGTVPKLDDSRVLLAQGIISILLVAFAIMLYVINILDAYRNAERFNRNEEIKDPKARMVATWDKTFPYLLISPGTFLLIFVVVFNDEFGAINNDILQPLLGVAPAWLSDPFWAKVALIGIQVWL